MAEERISAPFADAKFIDTYKYRKFYVPEDPEGEKTGRVIVLHDIKFPVCVIDIDFQNQTDESKLTFINSLLPLLPKHTVVVKTAHNGVHIYAKHKLYLKFNRYVKVQKTETCDIDFFIAGIPEKKSCLVCPPTRVLDSKTGKELQYQFILNDYNVPDLPDLDEVISAIQNLMDLTKFKEFIDLYRNPPKPKPPKVIPPFVNKQFFDVVIDGINGFEIVDDSEMEIEKGLSIQYLFKALNAIIGVNDVTKENVDEYYQKIIENNTMSEEIRQNFGKFKEEFKNEKSQWNDAVKILKIHRKEYNNEKIIPLTKNVYRKK